MTDVTGPRASDTPPSVTRTCAQVMEDSFWDIIRLAYQHDMTDDEIDAVLGQVIDDRASKVRASFKIHRPGTDDESD